jgi:predicted nucleic acid-binding protein
VTSSPSRLICDSGPIIHLDELHCLHLLGDFAELLISDTVRKEITRHRPLSISERSLLIIFSSANIPNNPQLLTLCRLFSLDVGETEALALMEKNPDAIFLTDDASARMVADQMGFKVHGTIGILLRAIRRGQVTPKNMLAILQGIPSNTSLYIKPSLLDEIIHKVEKEFNL